MLHTALPELMAIVGPGNCLTSQEDMEPFSLGARHEKGHAAFVVSPADSKTVSAVISWAVRNRVQLIPQSGNTGLVGASTTDGSGLQGILSLKRMSKIHSIDVANRTMIVEAGVRLSQINQTLEEHNLFFPIDLGADPMIGGMLATNTGGARFLRYGDVRRNVLALEVVLPDENGTIVQFGSDLRKNNTGVDFKQLFIGSSGSFGVITSATIELHRKPQQQAAALLVPSTPDAIPLLLQEFEKRAGETLSAFEGMSKEAMEAAFDHVPSLRNPFANGQIPEFAILVELSRSYQPIEGEIKIDLFLEAILSDIWGGPEAALADALMGEPKALWSLRHALSEGVKAAGQIIAFDLAFSRSNLPRFRREMRRILQDKYPALRICDFGHIGDGGLHFNCVNPASAGPALSQEGVLELRSLIIETAIKEFSGSFSAEHAIGPSNQSFYDRFTPNKHRQMASTILAMTSNNNSTGQVLGRAKF